MSLSRSSTSAPHPLPRRLSRPSQSSARTAGLLAFLYGTWCAMDAAFGTPGQDDYVSGPRLQQWDHDQAKNAVVKLRTGYTGRQSAS